MIMPQTKAIKIKILLFVNGELLLGA